MPNTQLTRENIERRVKSRLGGSAVDVELEPTDYDTAIEDTLDHYNQVRPFKRRARLNVTTSQKRYVLSTTDYPGMAGLINMEFITRRTQPAQVDPFDPFDTALAGITLGSGSGETYGEIAQRLTYSEDAARIVDSEPDWEYVNEDGEHVVYVDIPRGHIEAGFEWSGYYTPDTNANTGMQLIPNGDVKWFIDYCTALLQVRLGNARNKFQGIVSPDNSVDPVDGQELIQRGEDALQRLEEQLEARRPPLGPLTE